MWVTIASENADSTASRHDFDNASGQPSLPVWVRCSTTPGGVEVFPGGAACLRAGQLWSVRFVPDLGEDAAAMHFTLVAATGCGRNRLSTTTCGGTSVNCIGLKA